MIITTPLDRETLKLGFNKYLNNSLFQLQNKTLLVTGATGFFGKWLLRSIEVLNHEFLLNCKVWAMARNPKRFCKEHSDLNYSWLNWIEGDLADDFDLSVVHHVDFVLHMGTSASVQLVEQNPEQMYKTVVNGTHKILQKSQALGATKILLTSSGAIYGQQDSEIHGLSEDSAVYLDCSQAQSVYAEGKRMAENICAVYSKSFGIDAKIARCFAFAGPDLPFDTHFAAGNFVFSAWSNLKILIAGDGTPYRSYMYPTDLMVWLFKILLEGQSCRPYNVGSDQAVSILELAQAIQKKWDVPIEIKSKPSLSKPKRYVPSILRAQTELGLKIDVSLDEALSRWNGWYKLTKSAGLA